MNKHPQPDTAPVTTNLADAAAFLRQRGITEAAVLRASLPQAWGFVKPVRVDDLATLKRQANATGAVIASGAEAAEVSRLVAQLRRRARLLSLLPSARAEEPTAPDAEKDASNAEKPIQNTAKTASDTAEMGPNSAHSAAKTLHLDINEALKAEENAASNAENPTQNAAKTAPKAAEMGPNSAHSAAKILHLDINEALKSEGAAPARAENDAANGMKSAENAAKTAPEAAKTGQNSANNAAQPLPLDMDEALKAEENAAAEGASSAAEPAPDTVETPEKAPESSAANADSGSRRAAEPEKKPADGTAEPLFVVLIDSLAEVPALADLPGAQPELVAVGAIAAEKEAVTDALRRAYACATDTLWEKHADGPIAAKAKYVLSQSRELLARHSTDAAQAAALLLERGHEGGYAFLLGTALSRRYGLPLGEAAEKALPGLQQAMEGTAAEVETLPQLRLRDVPALAEAACRPRRAMARALTVEELAQALRCLYVPMAGPMQAETLLPRQRAFFASGRRASARRSWQRWPAGWTAMKRTLRRRCRPIWASAPSRPTKRRFCW